MVAHFIRLNILIIILFCNDVVFGMMSKNLSPLEDENLIHEIVSNCSFDKQLELRVVCKVFANQDKIFFNICNDYYKKQTSMACVLLNYVHKNDHKKVEWFVKNNQIKILCVVDKFYNGTKWLPQYNCIDPRYIFLRKNECDEPINIEMTKVFSKYSNEDLYKSIQRGQKKFTEQGYFNELMQRRDNCKNENYGLDMLLFRVVFSRNRDDIDDNLVIMACSGNIKKFNEELNKHNNLIVEELKNNKEKLQSHKTSIDYQQNISLVWLAALENEDIPFINNLFLHQDYKNHIQNKENRDNLLSFFILNTAIENVQDLKLDNKITFSKNRINKVLKLIDLGFFLSIPSFIENNKDNNDINKIYQNIIVINQKNNLNPFELYSLFWVIQDSLNQIEKYLPQKLYEEKRTFIQKELYQIEQALNEELNDNERALFQKQFNQIKTEVSNREQLYQTKRNNEMCPIQ